MNFLFNKGYSPFSNLKFDTWAVVVVIKSLMVYVVFCIGFPGYPTGLIQTPTATPGERQVSPAIYADIGATTSHMATNALQIQRSEPSPLPVSNSPLARVGEQLLTAQRTGTNPYKSRR